mmetsp:Transcript_12955/g.40376  ORF Transcript_12955/g.40376 Transcript_12955/m.40376 type:complete len:264 (-) Transcript_12955:530-1321(-)
MPCKVSRERRCAASLASYCEMSPAFSKRISISSILPPSTAIVTPKTILMGLKMGCRTSASNAIGPECKPANVTYATMETRPSDSSPESSTMVEGITCSVMERRTFSSPSISAIASSRATASAAAPETEDTCRVSTRFEYITLVEASDSRPPGLTPLAAAFSAAPGLPLRDSPLALPVSYSDSISCSVMLIASRAVLEWPPQPSSSSIDSSASGLVTREPTAPTPEPTLRPDVRVRLVERSVMPSAAASSCSAASASATLPPER